MIKQIGASVRRVVRTWFKAIYWKLSPLYRRLIALENQVNAVNQQTFNRIGIVESKLEIMNQQIHDRLGAAVSELREDGNGRRGIIRQTLDKLGAVESKLKIMNQTMNMVSVKTSALTSPGGGGGKRTITVFFLVHNIEVWSSLHGVYRAMLEDEQFTVIVASCNRKYPSGTSYHDEDVVHEGLQKAGVHHIRFTSEGGWEDLNILKRLRPDVIFRQSQWDNDIPPAFSVENLRFARLYSVPYVIVPFFDNSKKFSTNFSHNLECTFVVNEALKQEYETNDVTGATRAAATGHPRVDEILSAEPDWPLHTHNTFRVLWSPHHSIFQGWYDFGTFLTTCEPILSMATNIADVDFLLAIHPGLIGSFERLEKEFPETHKKVRNFFIEWDRLPNTSTLWHGGYMTAMKASDLLITDGISLLIEYQFVNKPILFIEREGHAAFNSLIRKMSSGWNTVASTDMDALREMVLYFKAGGIDGHAKAQIENVTSLTQHRNVAENILRTIKQDVGR
jgi:hypothetical protein